MIHHQIHAALARERRDTLLAEAEAARRARKSRAGAAAERGPSCTQPFISRSRLPGWRTPLADPDTLQIREHVS